jgi:hypothetical protein
MASRKRNALVGFVALISVALSATMLMSSRVVVRPSHEASIPARDFPGLDLAARSLEVSLDRLAVCPICTIEGTLCPGTGVDAGLYLVSAGVSRDPRVRATGLAIRVTLAHLDGDLLGRHSIHPQLAICHVTGTPTVGDVTFLACRSAPSSVGTGDLPTPGWRGAVRRKYSRVVSGWKKEIVYVEGNEEPSVYPGMSLDSFCQENKNRGDFLVVIVSLH